MHWQDARSTLLKELLTKSRIGIVSDFDGTLSLIVDQRDAAQIVPSIKPLLEALYNHVALLAIVSGRGVADLYSRINLPDLTYIGNHGLEQWIDGAARPLPQAEAYRPAMQAALSELPKLTQPLSGVDFEDKGATLTIHYRLADDPQHAVQTLAPLLQELAAQHGLKFSAGKMVFELKPPIQINKGTAFRDLVSEFSLDGALFLGDDTTDADALKAAQSMRADQSCYALGIGVESADMPPDLRAHADLLVSDPLDVGSFLGWLLEALSRKASSS